MVPPQRGVRQRADGVAGVLAPETFCLDQPSARVRQAGFVHRRLWDKPAANWAGTQPVKDAR